MRCTDSKCNFEMKKPLELYNGAWCCPKCKKNIFPNEDTKFEVTAHNREVFVRSEKNFYNWLTNDDKEDSRKKAAVDLCYEAAFENLPSALMRMGYYYDKGYADVSSSSERWSTAYFYYKAVLFNKHEGITKDGEEKYFDDLKEIKIECGKSILDLLGRIPPELRNRGSFDGMTFDVIKDEVEKRVVALGGAVEKMELQEFDSQQDSADMFLAALGNCNDKERAPIIGIFKLSNIGAERVIGEIDNPIIKNFFKKESHMGIANAYNDREAAERFAIIGNPKQLEEKLSQCPEAGQYIYFLNWNGGHEYVKKKDAKNIKIVLEGKNEKDQGIEKLIDAGKYNSCVFYDDDFHKFNTGLKRLSESEARDFIKEICEEY